MTATAVVQSEQVMLDAACRSQRAVRQAEVDLAVAALDWAVAHPPLDRADRCCVRVPRPGSPDGIEPLNAEGVPEVSAVAVAELAVALGMSTESGRRLVSDVLELAYRLPAVWERLLDGRLLVWQARRIAELTHPLARLAARFVDRHLGAVVGRIALGQVERLVQEAVVRHDQALAAARIVDEGDRRRFDVGLHEVGLNGQVPVHGLIDLPDAIALDAAVAHAATQLAALGSTDLVGARRARALGDLAREHLELWDRSLPSGRVVVDTGAGTVTPIERVGHGDEGRDDVRGGPMADEPGGADVAAVRGSEFDGAPVGNRGRLPRPDDGADRDRVRASRRQLVLHVHLSDRAITGGGAVPLGRVDNGNVPVTAETIRRWCGDPHTSITVRPVLDLKEGVHHAGYEIPTRLREQVIGRDVTCVYPGCQVPARRCDVDHIVPYDHEAPGVGGQTETSNLAALCRRHHRLKTTGRIGYRMVSPGVYEWTFPTGTRARRDLLGTELIEPDPSSRPGLRLVRRNDDHERRGGTAEPPEP